MSVHTLDDDQVAWPEDAVEVGRILDAWGVKGWIKVQAFSSDPQALFSSRRWFLQPPADKPRPAGAPALPKRLRITQAKDHGELVVACAQEIPDRPAAEALKGARIFVARSSFPTAETDEFYWVDLIGLSVVNRQGEALGMVTDLLDTGAHSVLRLSHETKDETGKPVAAERLIPFVAAYIDTVDLPGRRIVVDWGLDY